jgi:hypothetical protein
MSLVGRIPFTCLRFVRDARDDTHGGVVRQHKEFVGCILVVLVATMGCQKPLPPTTPILPEGSTSGVVGIVYSYQTAATSVNGFVAYRFDWGDGRLSNWTEYTTGGRLSQSHIWFSPGTFGVKAQAMDESGGLSDWSPNLDVAIAVGGINSIGQCETPGCALGVAIMGSYAYVADYGSGLRVIDVSDPTTPFEAGSFVASGCAEFVVAFNESTGTQLACVAYGTSGLYLVDVTTPSSPHLEGSCGTPGYAYGLAVSGGAAFVADGGSGLRVIDISSPVAPVEIGSCATPRRALAVAAQGGYAYVADGEGGLCVVDITDLAHPAVVAVCSLPGCAEDIVLEGSRAYVADGGTGLAIVDVANPAAPTLLGTYATPGYAFGVDVGNYACVADDTSGLRVFDISNPANPLEVGYADTPGQAYGVAIVGNYAYVADGVSGLRVFSMMP